MVANYWPKGYEEDFKTTDINVLTKWIDTLKGESVLEIGCGNGRWTSELLVPRFKKVVAIDIIDQPVYTDFEYHKADNLKMFKDKSFDCVFSNGVFCHLTLSDQQEYLNDIKRIMKKNGLIMFANWKRHPMLIEMDKNGYKETAGWFYNNLSITDKMIKKAGLNWIDADDTNRDTLAIIW